MNIFKLSIVSQKYSLYDLQQFPHPAMFTDEDLYKLKKINKQYHQKREEQSKSSSAIQDKTEEELYFCKYFLNDNFKILLIEIVATEQVTSSLARIDSYMIYVIKVVTEEFSYEVRRRYSQFLKLHESILGLAVNRDKAQRNQSIERISLNKFPKLQYSFPSKRLSSSLRHFFNICSKEKLAQERKSELCSFLNQIKSKYYNFPDQFTDDYVELLKFIDMKEQHQKFWRRKQGHFLEISKIALKEENPPNQAKINEKTNDPCQVNIEYLSQLLQHQMNKINLAVNTKQSVFKSSPNLGPTAQQVAMNSDPMVTDEIIKNVDCIRDIVLEMKRKINYQHIRCILKGKDIKQNNALLSKSKKGLVQYCLKHTINQLVAMHILRTILFVFANCQCNYSSDAFIKVLSEIQLSVFMLNQEKQEWALHNKDFREVYFKLIKQYQLAKQQYGADKKQDNIDKLGLQKIMGAMLAGMYQAWSQLSEKNKQFKIKDEQKQWTLVIENFPRNYCPKKTHQSCLVNIQLANQSSIQIVSKHAQNKIHKSQSFVQCHKLKYSIKQQNQHFKMTLTTNKIDDYFIYLLVIDVKDRSYKQCLEIMKQQKKWNPLLLNSQTDIYSSTRKDCLKIPSKQEKIFRFKQHQEIQMNLQEDSEENQVQTCENFVSVGNFQELQTNQKQQNPKSSTQTMPSTNGSCAHEHMPEYNEGLASSKLSRKTILIKSPPSQGVFNSYNQQVRIERGLKTKASPFSCNIQIEIIFTQPSVYKYFASELDGSTQYIWQGLKQCFGNQTQ